MNSFFIPVGQPIVSSESYQSVSINVFNSGGSPTLSWNNMYNNNKVLELEKQTDVSKFYIIDFTNQPFNYIDISTNVDKSKIVVINNMSANWLFVRNVGLKEIIISPQINGSTYDYTSEKTLTSNSYNFIATMPNLVNLKNPTFFELQ